VHFAAEEKEMQAGGFPPYAVHQQEHQRVLNEMAAQIATWKTQRDMARLSQYVKEALPEWLSQHTQSMDFVIAAWLANQK
jgi:hemerythrin-like metal-binding protein